MRVFGENRLDFIGAESGKIDLTYTVFHVEKVAGSATVGEWVGGGKEGGVVGGRVRLVLGVWWWDEWSPMAKRHWEKGLVTCVGRRKRERERERERVK